MGEVSMKPAEIRKLSALLEAFSKELTCKAPMAFEASYSIGNAREIVKKATEQWTPPR